MKGIREMWWELKKVKNRQVHMQVKNRNFKEWRQQEGGGKSELEEEKRQDPAKEHHGLGSEQSHFLCGKRDAWKAVHFNKWV